jgi:hypothetical protein
MRDLITLTALVVSISGIAVSLAREEVRCHLGFPSASCPQSSPVQGEKPEIDSDRPDPPSQPAASQPKILRDRPESQPDLPDNTEPATPVLPEALPETPPEQPTATSPFVPNSPSPEVTKPEETTTDLSNPLQSESSNPLDRPIPLKVEPPPSDSPQ